MFLYSRILILFLFMVVFLQPGMVLAQDPSTVSGKVFDASGNAVTDATATLVELRRKVKVNESGEFAIEGVPAGQYLLVVESQRSGQVVQSVMVKAGEQLKLEVSLDRVVHSEEVVVSANPDAQAVGEVYQPVSVLSGNDLTISNQPTLGETLSNEVGVNSTYFGPGASRPVIRGLGGDRIRVLIDGIGTGDASSTSPDHAVSSDSSSAERIEIVRGPATLLYGSSAIGGIVNVLDNRIPSYRSEKPIGGSFEFNLGSVADQKYGTGALEGSLGSFGWHLDLMRRDTNDYNIPGFAESEHIRSEEAEHEGEEEEEAFGFLPNSSLEADSLTGGVSYIGDTGFLGVSYSGFDTNYGIPGHAHGHEEEHIEEQSVGSAQQEEEADVRIDLQQRRFDVRGEVSQPFAAFRGLKFRLGATDYEHTELEGEEVGTLFFNNSWETRVEALHRPIAFLNGSFGVQVANRDFEAIGEEAFVPPTNTDNWAAFVFEEMGSEVVKLQLGARYERQNVTAVTEGINERTLDGVSASAGLLWLPNDDYSASVSIARSVKLPNAEELFANGPHIATMSFEIGDPHLNEETSIGFDASLRKRTGRFTGEFSFFTNRLNDFIFEQATGEEEDGLPVFQFVQQKADFTGLEFHGDLEVLHIEPHHISLEFQADYVRAENRDTSEPLPRIPPMRLGAGIRYQDEKFWGLAEVRYTGEQDRVSEFEEPTASFTFFNASIGYRLFAGNTVHDIILRGTNLTNEEGRNHVSFLKELAPLPGRDVRLIYKLLF